jgi:hypothetical protein
MIYYPKTEQICDLSCCPFATHPDIAECYFANCPFVCDLHCPPGAWLHGKAVGFTKIRILPHRQTRIPLLTVKLTKEGQEVNIATLCRSCALSYSSFVDVAECRHTDDERALEGCWNLNEVVFAVQRQNYSITHVYSTVWFQHTRDDVLEDLMTVLAKTKIKNSPVPESENFDDFLQHLNAESGLNLHRADFINPSLAMRSAAKQLMVSNILFIYIACLFTNVRVGRVAVHSFVDLIYSFLFQVAVIGKNAQVVNKSATPLR